MKKLILGISVALTVTIGATLVGCHADPDNPKGQANELSDSVRREYALGNIQRLFGSLLVKIGGNRSDKAYKDFVDATIEQLVKAYIDNPTDTKVGSNIISLLSEMNDVRALSAFLQALDWRAEVSEDQAITAAQAIQRLAIPEAKLGDVVKAVCDALERIDGARGVDNRMRKAFIETLGTLNDKRATETLIKVALTQSESQNFLFNILAAQQLISLADPSSIPAMIKGLFIFDPKNPAARMNDVAASALVAIGKPALQPLIELIKGQNSAVTRIVEDYIQTIKQRDPQIAATMTVPGLVSAEATYALGKLGDRDALDALLGEAASKDETSRFSAAIALVTINRKDEDTPRIIEAMKKVYDSIEAEKKPQMLVAMRHLYASEIMPVFLNILESTSTILQSALMPSRDMNSWPTKRRPRCKTNHRQVVGRI